MRNYRIQEFAKCCNSCEYCYRLSLCGYGIKKWNSTLAMQRKILDREGVCDNYKRKED